MTQKVLEEVPGGITADDVAKARNAVLDIQAEISERQEFVSSYRRSRNYDPKVKNKLPVVCDELRALILDRITAEWRAVVLSLDFAAQGPADLMGHPGYGSITSSEIFPFPLYPQDIPHDLYTQGQAVKEKVRSLLHRFEEGISSIDADLAVFRSAADEVVQKQKALEELKELRRHAAARGESTHEIAVSIGAAVEEVGRLQAQVAMAEDDSAGLDLRRAAFLRAKSCAEEALSALDVQLSVVELCAIASDYNGHAQKAAELIVRFRGAAAALPRNARRLPVGVPSLPGGCKVYIPEIRLHQLNKDGTSVVGWDNLYLSIIVDGVI